MKSLERLHQLEALDLGMAGPSDEVPEVVGEDGFIIEQESWFTLPKLPKLRGLNLYEAAFRGDGLENIPSIEHLVLFGTALTDDAAKKLTQLQHLKILSLGETNITTKSLPYLAPLTQMQELGLTLKITDDGLHHLSRMHDLRSLTFDGAEITDASIPIFKRFTKLEYLNMGPTKMTKKGLDELHSAFPKCEFY